MARISQFVNQYTKSSIELSEEFKSECSKLTLEKTKELQKKYGVSNAELSRILEIEEASVSRWKNGKYNLG
jgi:DNA-binding transcriptional regulator YiaG